jgi:hypothetical protein
VGRVWLRAGPGVQYAVVSEILAGTRLPLLGSSPDGEWVQVSYPPAPQGTAWIYSKLITQIQDDIPNNTPADATAALQVSATNARRESDRLYIDVCFELPDNRDWTIFDALLEYGSEGMWREVPPAESILLSITEPPAADSSGQRCDTLEFHLFSEKYITNPRLDILSVVAEPREGGSCALYLNEVQSRLDAQNSGIRIACEEAPHSLGQATVVQWPEGMSQQDALWIVQKAYRDMNTVKGPWIFPLDETQLAPPQRESGDSPPLAGLLELHDLRVSNFPMPGWLHLLTRHFEREINGATSAVDGPATEYQLDAWYYLDEQGQLAQAVERRLSNEGQASQVRVLQDALWHDLNTNEVTPHDPAASFHLDFGFLADAAYAVKTGKRLTRQPAYAEGIYLGDQYVLEDETCIKKALFDPYSGQLLSLYVYTVNPGASGPPEETDLLSSVVVLSIETPAEAPDEVLAYFLK